MALCIQLDKIGLSAKNIFISRQLAEFEFIRSISPWTKIKADIKWKSSLFIYSMRNLQCMKYWNMKLSVEKCSFEHSIGLFDVSREFQTIKWALVDRSWSILKEGFKLNQMKNNE